jgi:glycosyltransferase involved in cell wall biosynthesis
LLDLHPEGIIKLGMLKKSGLISRIWTWLNGVAYRKAGKIGVLGRDMIPILEENYQIDANRIFYFPHWSAVEVEVPKTFENSDLVRKLNLSDKFVVQYSGNMGLWHDMNAFVHAAKLLEDYADICFLFIGGGLKKDEALKLSQSMNISNIVWHDFVPIGQLTDSLSASHVSLISLKEGLSGVAVPCKLYGILSSGRCVLAQVPSNSEVSMTVLESNCGVVVEPGDFEGLAAKILELRNDPEKTLKFGCNSFLSYKEKYRLSNAQATFIKHVF